MFLNKRGYFFELVEQIISQLILSQTLIYLKNNTVQKF